MDLSSSALNRARTLGSRFFYKFGIHCATHQIRVILISCVVITSLFYPALAIYASSQTQILSDSTSRILDAFLAPNTVPGFYVYAQHDLRNLWRGYSTLRIRDDAVSRARCGLERTVRVERILIQSPLIDDLGALNRQILLSTLQLERRISNLVNSRRMPCLRTPSGQCFVLSPLAFWGHNEEAVRSDQNILDTLRLSRNITISGVSVSPHMVLAGRRTNDPTAADLDFAMFLAVTYFFPDTDCLGSTSHSAFLHILESATHGEELVIQAQQPTLIALEYDPSQSKNQGLSAISAFLYLAYSGFFAYVTWSMRRMDGVHSRIGLTFTALVEIAVSTVTSLSVCALVGFRVTMVPWELLPIVIVFVGAENMFNLVDAVTKTSVALPVNKRIAEGLSRAGTSNSLKVLSYNSLLGVLAFFEVGAIRQFCVFAIVVLVAHWFLAHTFFMAVLSIDMQRLELQELLRQNPSLTPPVPKPNQLTAFPPDTPWQKLALTIQGLLQGRAKKNISLVLLLATTATLYYTTYPGSSRTNDSSITLSRPVPTASDQHSPAWHIWKLLNPGEDPLLHLRIELPSILTFRPVRTDDPSDQQREHLFRTLRPLVWFLKIVFLPIAATTFALYGLLLYLLKNTELLEAQRHRSHSHSTSLCEKMSLEGLMSFSTLPRVFGTDVDLLATSQDGRIVASVGMQNELVIWRMGNRSYSSIDITDVLLRSASSSSAAAIPTALAVDDEGRYCALGMGSGVTGVWIIGEDTVRPFTHLWTETVSNAVRELQFMATARQTRSPSSSPVEEAGAPSLVVVHDSGLAFRWDVSFAPSGTYLIPSWPGIVKHCRILQDSPSILAYTMQDGRLEVVEVVRSGMTASVNCNIHAGNPADLVSHAHVCYIGLGGTRRLIIAAATMAGVVSLWDGLTGGCIAVLDEVQGEIDMLRISPVHSKACHYCGELPLESFAISLSARQRVSFYTAYMSVQSRRCTCPHNQPKARPARDILVGRHSRTNSVTISSRARLSQETCASGTQAFPVSGHGVHSRRASEKESIRRQEILSVPPATEENEPAHAIGPAEAFVPAGVWRNVVIVRSGDATCERGCWAVCRGKIMGIRRRSQSAVAHEMGGKGTMAVGRDRGRASGLSGASLERWEVWAYDPSSLRVRGSSLCVLEGRRAPSEAATAATKDRIPRLPFTRVSPLVASSSLAVAGFGNTIGVLCFGSDFL